GEPAHGTRLGREFHGLAPMWSAGRRLRARGLAYRDRWLDESRRRGGGIVGLDERSRAGIRAGSPLARHPRDADRVDREVSARVDAQAQEVLPILDLEGRERLVVVSSES